MHSTHENLSRDEDIKGSSDRAFGLVFAAVFLVIALLPLFFGKPPRLWAITVSAAFGLVALATPRWLAWPNYFWTRFGMLLHHVISPVALALVFYVAIMPTGLLMRLFGKDPLRLRREPEATTYWIARTPPGPSPDSLNNQF